MKCLLSLLIAAVFIASCKPSVTENRQGQDANSNCKYSRNEKSPMGMPIRVVEDEKFISLAFTDTTAQKRYTSDDLLKGYLSCVRVDSVLGIYFDFKIYSAEAYEKYGMIKKGDKIVFTLASGSSIAVPFSVTFSGNTNLSAEYSEYTTFGRLQNEDAEAMKASEIQAVKIYWSKKEEDYKVVNPKIFINQIPCVE